jgi:hypothetical protein
MTRKKASDTGRTKLRPRVSSRPGGTGGLNDGRWWALEDEKRRGEALWQTALTLDQYSGARHMVDALYVGIYENNPPFWLGNQASQSPAMFPFAGEISRTKTTLNVLKSATDTVAALLSKNLAEIRVLSSGGTWRQQQRAKKLTKYLAGAFDLTGYHAHQQRAFIDGCLTRKGAVKFWADKSRARVCCERIAPHTLLWNDLEGDQPQNLYEKRAFPREQLKSSFPEHADKIEKASTSGNPGNPAYRRMTGLTQQADMVDVVSGWHLPPDAKTPGMFVTAIEGTVLEQVEWKHDFFPFATFSWDDAHEGWGGKPLADILIGYQIRLGRMMRVIQRSQDLACVPRVWRERTAEVVNDHVTNEIGGVGDYVGQPPVIAPGNAMAAEYYQFFWKLKEEALAEAGISLLQSRGEKPSGLDSEPSLREYNDITNTRQVTKGQRLERMTEQAGEIVIALSRDLYNGHPGLRVLAPGTKFLEEIKWSEVDMEEDSYTLRSFAVSALPTHAVGRIQTVTELIKAGIVPQEEAAGLLGFPDLEKVVTLANANRDLALMQCDSALYEGEYVGPEPYQDLDLLVGMATKEYLFALQMSGVPRKNMEFLRRLIAEGDSMRKRAQAGASPAPGVAGAAPGQPAALPPGPVQPQLGAMPLVPPLQTPEAAALPSPALPTVNPAGVLG